MQRIRHITTIQDLCDYHDGKGWRLRKPMWSREEAEAEARNLAEQYLLPSGEFAYEEYETTVPFGLTAARRVAYAVYYTGEIPSMYCAHPSNRTVTWLDVDQRTGNQVVVISCADCGKDLTAGL